MGKVNVNRMRVQNLEFEYAGRIYKLERKHISKVLGSTREQPHPFDVEQVKLGPGCYNWPRHTHSHWTEFYLIISGKAIVNRNESTFEVEEGDCFIQAPGTSHRMFNPSEERDLVYYVVCNEDGRDTVTREGP